MRPSDPPSPGLPGEQKRADLQPLELGTAETFSDKSSNHRLEAHWDASASCPASSSTPSSSRIAPQSCCRPPPASHRQASPRRLPDRARQQRSEEDVGSASSQDASILQADICGTPDTDSFLDSDTVSSVREDSEPSSTNSWRHTSAQTSPARTRTAAVAARAKANNKALEALRLLQDAQSAFDESTVTTSSAQSSKMAPCQEGLPTHVLSGSRISVFWPDDQTYYRGRIVAFDPVEGCHKVRYDDEAEEWLVLAEEQFKWLGPKGTSAGCTAQLQAHMAELGAPGAVDPVAALCPAPPQPAAALAPAPPLDGAAVAWKLAVYFLGCRRWCMGEVLAFNPCTGLHHVGYHDGEDEWLDLDKECLVWMQPPGSVPFCTGLPAGDPVPLKNSPGWRVSLYWPDDQAFYPAQITAFDPPTQQHHLQYDDGEQEACDLRRRQVKWLQRPAPLSSPQPVSPPCKAPKRGSASPPALDATPQPALQPEHWPTLLDPGAEGPWQAALEARGSSTCLRKPHRQPSKRCRLSSSPGRAGAGSQLLLPPGALPSCGLRSASGDTGSPRGALKQPLPCQPLLGLPSKPTLAGADLTDMLEGDPALLAASLPGSPHCEPDIFLGELGEASDSLQASMFSSSSPSLLGSSSASDAPAMPWASAHALQLDSFGLPGVGGNGSLDDVDIHIDDLLLDVEPLDGPVMHW